MEENVWTNRTHKFENKIVASCQTPHKVILPTAHLVTCRLNSKIRECIYIYNMYILEMMFCWGYKVCWYKCGSCCWWGRPLCFTPVVYYYFLPCNLPDQRMPPWNLCQDVGMWYNFIMQIRGEGCLYPLHFEGENLQILPAFSWFAHQHSPEVNTYIWQGSHYGYFLATSS